ncbi:FAD:protein FMN transferase [Lachnospiraceae bacterium]|nr:FAD:protein FMN transferase [Lachnospiraceae bacterium]MCI9059474.1 FAD:protein FMN transferase [Lachnospiraceae bacterium]GFI33048.1 FAD:protein FMN transferase [Lachnospiraceae bacterium]
MKRKHHAVILLLAVILLMGAAALQQNNTQPTRYEVRFFDSFDTITTITGYAKSQEEFEEQTKLLQEKLMHYHQLFDIYHTYEGMNNLKSINDAAGKSPLSVDQDIIELLKLGIEMHRKTNGAVNIAYGSVLSLWHEYREQGTADPEHAKVPPKALIQEKAAHTDISKVVIRDGTVFLEDGEMSLDVGSIGKGYAVQKISEYARELGMDHLLISVGGNVSAVGAKADNTPWRVGIENPDLESAEPYIGTVELADQTIVTSGDYQRFYVADGKRYCHIIDPETGMPPEYVPSVSVLTENSGMADAWSTALFNMEIETGLELVETLPETEALWVMKDGGVRSSSGFEFHEKK